MRTNLPARLPTLIGREDEVAEVVALLSSEDAFGSDHWSVGTGKTRLALAVGADVLPVFADGVFFVDLSALTDASLVIPAIAQALSLWETGRSLAQTLRDYLSSKRMVLILDNFEQVMAAAGEVSSFGDVVSLAQDLVTLREALRIEGEREFPLAPSEILASPAVDCS